MILLFASVWRSVFPHWCLLTCSGGNETPTTYFLKGCC